MKNSLTQEQQQFIENLKNDEGFISNLKQAFNEIIDAEKQKLENVKKTLEQQKATEQDIWSKYANLPYSEEKDRLFKERNELKKEISFNEKLLINFKNSVKALENFGDLATITDSQGREHYNIPIYTKIPTETILFDAETILSEPEPNYIPYIDEDYFKRKGYIFDAIRIANDTYLISTIDFKFYEDKLPETTDEKYYQPLVLVTLDQLVLAFDYYTTKAKARLIEEAEKRTKRQEKYYDSLPESRRESHFKQKGFYNSLPSNVKKKISQDKWEALSLSEKESLYKPHKRYRAKQIKSKLDENQMWSSFHEMYRIFMNKDAWLIDKNRIPQVGQKTGFHLYANPETVSYWKWFKEYLEYKIKDINMQRVDLSESRKAAIETSFGESNTSDILKDEFGFLVKRQNGDDIKPFEVEEIKEAWVSVREAIGELKDSFLENSIKISHSGNRLIFASKAIGVFIPEMGTVGVSNKYGETQFKLTLAHELGHFIDWLIGKSQGKRWATDDYEGILGKIAFAFRNNMNKPKELQTDYVNNTKECFARAIEQYYGYKILGEKALLKHSYVELDKEYSIFVADDFVSREKFEKNILPLLDEFFETYSDFFKYNTKINTDMPIMTREPQSVEDINTENLPIEETQYVANISNDVPTAESKQRFSTVKEIDRTQITTSPKDFQGRQHAYSEESVNKIVSEGFDKTNDPIVVWYDKTIDKYIVISGHSRFEASRRLYEAGDKSLQTMPVKEFLGDKDEAISYAVLESNRASTQEGLISDINAVRKMLTDGYNKAEMIKYVKPQSYLENIIRYTYLNPNGKFIEYLSSPSKSSFPYLERNASWVGDLRKKYSEKLTDLHESEIFDYIYNSGSSKGLQLSKEQLYNLINSKVMKLDYNNQNPLNLMNIVSTSTIISPVRDKINEMKSDVDYWQKEIQKKQDLIVRARLEGNQDLVSKFQTFISDATSRILDIKEKIQKLESELNTVQNSVVHDLFSNVSENSEMAKIEADYVSYEMKKAESEMIGDLKEDVNECNNEIIDFSKKYNKELIQVNSDISINNMPHVVVSIDSEKIKFKQNFGKHNNSSELILTFDELSELFSKGKIEFSNYKTEEFATFDLMLKIKQICLIKESNLKSAMGMANYSVETISNMSLALKELSESKDAIEVQLNSVEQEKQLLQEQKENQKKYSKVLTKLYGIDFKAEEISGKSQPIENESTEVIKKYVEYIKSEVSKMETPFDDYIYMELQDSNYHSLNLVLGLLGFYKSNHYEWAKTHDRYDNIISIVDEILNPKPIEPPKPELSKKEIIEKKLKGLNVAFKYADKDKKAIIEKKIKGLKVALKYSN